MGLLLKKKKKAALIRLKLAVHLRKPVIWLCRWKYERI